MSSSEKPHESQDKIISQEGPGGRVFRTPAWASAILTGAGALAVKLSVPVFLAAFALLFLDQIKSALGISAIEKYLIEFQRSVAYSEDTVFYHQYRFAMPSFSKEAEMLASYGIRQDVIKLLDRDKIEALEPTFQEFWRGVLNEERAKADDENFEPISSGLELPEEIADRVTDDINLLRRANLEIDQPHTRSFPFSAAPNALVTIWHSVSCRSDNNLETDEVVAYSLKVDQVQMSKSGKGEHHEDLDLELVSDFNLVPTKNGSNLRQLALVLEIAPDRGATDGIRPREALERRVIGNVALSSCTFEIMIYVRDNPQEFVPGGIGRSISDYLGKTLEG